MTNHSTHNYQHYKYLRIALEEARTRRGFCAPNPSVGAVLVMDNLLVTGCHYQAGSPHAEVVAIRSGQAQLATNSSAILYVTLEPCCHTGRTPPCTDLIIKNKIKKVIFAYLDPNPIVAGKGMQTLIDNGIDCEHIEIPEITSFYQSYQYYWKYKKPYITFKLALSANGMYAQALGERVQITGNASTKLTHQYRLQSDAILTTAKTILIDNPQFNIRYPEIISKNLYVLDRHSQLSGKEKIFKTMNVIVLKYEKLKDVIEYFGGLGVHDLWVEAGGKFLSSFIQEKLVNKIILYNNNKSIPYGNEYYFDKNIIKDPISKGFRLGEDWVEEIECSQE